MISKALTKDSGTYYFENNKINYKITHFFKFNFL